MNTRGMHGPCHIVKDDNMKAVLCFKEKVLILGFDICEQITSTRGMQSIDHFVDMRTWHLYHRPETNKSSHHPAGLFATAPAEPPLFTAPTAPEKKRKSALKPSHPMPKSAAAEPEAKRFKGADTDLPEALVAVQKDAAAISEALELHSLFHVNDIGLHEAFLGCGLILAWTAHADYPAGALPLELVELIGRHQADGTDAEVTQALESHQRTILAGLINFEAAVALYTESYMLCVKARRDVHKDEISKLLGLLPPVVRVLSNLPTAKKYQKQKAHGWQLDLSKVLALAFLALEAHKPEETPAEEIAENVEEDDFDDEDVDMTALASMFGSGWKACCQSIISLLCKAN